MPKFEATDLRYIESNQAIGAADPAKLANDAATVKVQEKTYELKSSEGEAPFDVVKVADDTEVKATLVFDSEDDLRAALNGTRLTEAFNDFASPDFVTNKVLETDEHTVGHWVFDKKYHRDKYHDENILRDLMGDVDHILTPSSGFDYQNQMTVDDPVYHGGKTLTFDGVNDCFIIPNAKAGEMVSGVNSFTVDAFIYGKLDTGYRGLIGCYGSYNLWYLSMSNGASGAKVLFRLKDDTHDTSTYSSTLFSKNDWYYISFVYYLSGLKVYLNGDLKFTYTYSEPNTEVNSLNDLAIGAIRNGTYFYDGEISEIRYSNVARTAQEIKENYQKYKNLR